MKKYSFGRIFTIYILLYLVFPPIITNQDKLVLDITKGDELLSPFINHTDKQNNSDSSKEPLAHMISPKSAQISYTRDYGYDLWGDNVHLYATGFSVSTKGTDLLLIKWDVHGNQLWSKTWGGPESDGGQSIWGDGTSLYTTGYTHSFGAGESDLLLIKWDTEGNQLWNRTWGIKHSVMRSTSLWGMENTLYGAGSVNISETQDFDIILAKWNSEGTQLWNRTWGGNKSDDVFALWGDDTFLFVIGATNSFGVGESDLLLIKWNRAGTQIWNKTWGGVNSDIGRSVWGEGSSIYGVGHTNNANVDNMDVLLVKWDINGNHVWAKTWGMQETMKVSFSPLSIVFTVLIVAVVQNRKQRRRKK